MEYYFDVILFWYLKILRALKLSNINVRLGGGLGIRRERLFRASLLRLLYRDIIRKQEKKGRKKIWIRRN